MWVRQQFVEWATLVMLLSCLGVSQAETYADTYARESGGGRPVPGFYGSIEANLVSDENIRRTDSDEQFSLVPMIKPDLSWVAVERKHVFRLGYQGTYARFLSNHFEDFDDTTLYGDAFLSHSKKLRTAFGAAFRRGHDERGASGIIDIFQRPNIWNQWSFKAEGLYGRKIAKAQAGLRWEADRRRYLNNNQDFRDYNDWRLTGLFVYNLGSKTQLFFEPSYEKRNYLSSFDNVTDDLDNSTMRYLLGVSWELTAKTTGVFKAGYYNRDYDGDIYEDGDGLALSADITWQPKTYSKVNLILSRDINDATQTVATNYVSTLAKLSWEHQLPRFKTLEIGVSYQNDEYNALRDDDIYNVNIGFSQSLSRRLSVGIRYDYDNRDSNLIGNNYKDNRITLGVRYVFR